jgi:hypothetical protein
LTSVSEGFLLTKKANLLGPQSLLNFQANTDFTSGKFLVNRKKEKCRENKKAFPKLELFGKALIHEDDQNGYVFSVSDCEFLTTGKYDTR